MEISIEFEQGARTLQSARVLAPAKAEDPAAEVQGLAPCPGRFFLLLSSFQDLLLEPKSFWGSGPGQVQGL